MKILLNSELKSFKLNLWLSGGREKYIETFTCRIYQVPVGIVKLKELVVVSKCDCWIRRNV